MKLTSLNATSMGFWANYFTSNSNLALKSINIGRKQQYLNWKMQLTHFTLSNYTGVINQVNNYIVLYPNPATDKVKIDGLDLDNSESHYKIYNSLGTVVVEGFLDSDSINIQNLDTGVYFIQIDEAILLVTISFIKEY